MAYKIPPSFPSLIVVLVVVSAAFRPSAGVEYRVENWAAGTPGGDRFDSDPELGVEFTVSVLSDASDLVRSIFAMPDGSDRNDVESITLIIDENVDGAAITVGNEIRVNAQIIKNLPESPRTDFKRLLYHVVTHIWQWKGKGEPLGLIEGMADYVVLKAQLQKKSWVFPGQGNSWDQGFDVTARFLDYLSTRFDDRIVAKLNSAMQNEFYVGIFEKLLQKPVEQLFKDYHGILP